MRHSTKTKRVFAFTLIFMLAAPLFCAAEDDGPGTIARKAVESGNLAKAKELIQNDPALLFQIIEKEMPGSFTTYDATLLHFATIAEQLAMVKFLLEQGASPTVRDSDNMTPIAYAAGRNNREITRYLWANGSTDPADDCMELSPFLHNMARLGGSEVSRERMQLVQQRAQILEKIVTSLQAATRGMNMQDYRLEIADRKINDFYKRCKIEDRAKYVLRGDSLGRNVEGKFHLSYAGKPTPSMKDEDFDNLANFVPNIYWLDLQSCEDYTDAGLKHVNRMKDLQRLWISGNDKITDNGLEGLNGLQKLEQLHIRFCENITDAGLVHLKELSALETLELNGNEKLTGSGLQHLKSLTQLTDLGLRYCENLTDSGLRHLKDLPALKKLNLGNNEKLTDAGLEFLKTLTKLESLNLEKCPNITDAGLEHLKGLKNLKYLTLTDCKGVTETGIARLYESLPDCKIYPEPKNASRNNSSSNSGNANAAVPAKTGDSSTETKVVVQPTNTEKRDEREDYSKLTQAQAEAEARSKKEVSLDLYYKAAGFGGGDRTFSNLLKNGTHQLWTEKDELQRKLRAADEFDKPGVQKQIDNHTVLVEAKQEEIKNKIFYQEYDDISPANVTVEGRTGSFTLNVSRGFLPKGEFGKFLSPFPGVSAKIRENEYGIPDRAAADVTGRVLPRWNTITVSGDTDSIKELVRGMRENPKAYSLKLWFTELQGVDNQVRELDLSNPFSSGRVRTEFIVVAKIVQIEIIDKANRSNNTFLGANANTITSVAQPKAESRFDAASSSAPALDKPLEWLKPLQQTQDLKPMADVQRSIAILEYAAATQNDTTYLKGQSEFFKALKRNVSGAYTRIDFINDHVLPEMIRRNNFEGLKEAMVDIDVMMTAPRSENDFNGQRDWAYYNAVLAGFALASGDEGTSNSLIDAGFSGSSTWATITTPKESLKTIALAVANKRIDWNTAFAKNNTATSSFTSRFCRIAANLAQYGKKSDYMELLSRSKKTFKESNLVYGTYYFAKADALLGEFDRARLHWKQYPAKDTGPWSHFLLSYIIRQEFLAGEFRGWDTMQDDIPIRRLNTVFKGEDLSYAVPAFYFDYGRGLARHKTGQEIMSEYDTLSSVSYVDEDELAFFMAGVATGLLDKKNPKQAYQSSSPSAESQTAMPQNTWPVENNQWQRNEPYQPAQAPNVTRQEPLPVQRQSQPALQPQGQYYAAPNAPQRYAPYPGERLERAAQAYGTARSIANRFGARLP